MLLCYANLIAADFDELDKFAGLEVEPVIVLFRPIEVQTPLMTYDLYSGILNVMMASRNIAVSEINLSFIYWSAL